jgi:hypothetical protein
VFVFYAFTFPKATAIHCFLPSALSHLFLFPFSLFLSSILNHTFLPQHLSFTKHSIIALTACER